MGAAYRIGGTGNWSDATKWSTTSGGSNDRGVPASSDDVFVDGSSGGGTLTIDGTPVCRSFDSNGFTGTVAGSANISVGDGTAGAGNIAWRWGTGITRTYSGQITFVSTSATQQTITSNGKTFGSRITINGAGSSYALGDAISLVGATLFVTAGSFTSNAKNMTIGAFNSTGSLTRSVILDNSTVTCVSTGTGGWSVTSTGLTLSTTNVSLTIGGATAMNFTGGGFTYGGTVILQTPTTSDNGRIFNANTFNNLTITGAALKTATLTLSANQTISNTLTINGNSVINRTLISSDTIGTARTITCNGTVTASNVDFRDITGAGSASWNLSAITGNSGDATGNSGITFTTGAKQTWSGTSGGNYSTNAWTTRIPLPQDDVDIKAAFSASQTITFDMPRLGKSIDFTGVSGSPILTSSTTYSILFGSLTLASGLGTCTGFNPSFYARGSVSITNAGKTIGNVDVTPPTTIVTQQDASSFAQLTLTNGTYNTNLYTSSWGSFVGTNGILNATNSTVTITGTLGFALSSAVPVMTGSTLIFTYAGSQTFTPHSETFNIITVSSGTTLLITDNVTINTIKRQGTTACGITVTAGKIITMTGGATAIHSGTSGNLITWQSSVNASPFFISSSTPLEIDYISLKDCTGSWSTPHYAGYNSTNGGGNTNWLFTSRPADPLLGYNRTRHQVIRPSCFSSTISNKFGSV